VILEAKEPAKVLHRAFLPFKDHNVAVGSAVFLGPATHYIGILEVVLGRVSEAEEHFAAALASHERVPARPLLARTRYEYGKVLDALGRADEAVSQLSEAVAEFDALGMKVCLARAHEALARLQEHPPIECPAEMGRATETEGRAVFRSDGDYWTMSFAGKMARIKGVRGFEYMAYLLARANQPVHALDLAVLGVRSPGSEVGVAAATQDGLHEVDLGSDGALLDERARVAYRRRLRELAVERDEVERLNDYGRVERIDEEIEVITTYLQAGSGLGRRSRRWASPAERARVNVRNAIAKALRSIRQHHEPLHRHLQNSIKTGAVCSYVPEQGVTWQVVRG
jgi:hypothetical protein